MSLALILAIFVVAGVVVVVVQVQDIICYRLVERWIRVTHLHER